MSAQPVDVLAVLKDAAEIYDSEGCPNAAEEMREARAAVAELIEAARAARERLDGEELGTDEDEIGWRRCCGVRVVREHAPDCPLTRLDAALARCGGASP